MYKKNKTTNKLFMKVSSKLTKSQIQDSLPLLIPADHTGQLVQCHPGLRPPVLQQLHHISCLKHPQQTHPHPFTTHSKNLIHSGITGSPNRDPSCSADTEPLTTRHPRRDDLRFVEHKLSVRLFHFLSSPLFTI